MKPPSIETTPAPSSIDAAELGRRLRAYRIGASLLAGEVAERLGISRAALYRMEQGKIVKIETLERLAQLLNTSLASLLGVEVEYYATASGFLERMRQIEGSAIRTTAHFHPISQLLASEDYRGHLGVMLRESIPDALPQAERYRKEAARVLDILGERRAAFARRRTALVALVGLREMEVFAQTGLIGTLALDAPTRARRVAAARREVEHIADLMENAPAHVEVGLIEDTLPSASFQLFYEAGRTLLAVSPFQFGEMPSIRNGIARVTAAPEPVRLYEEMTRALWENALKGKTGAARLRKLLK